MWSIGRTVLVAILLAVGVSGQGRTSGPAGVGTAGTAGSCEALSSLSTPNVRITSASLVAAGTFVPTLEVLYCLACEGRFAHLIRFEVKKEALSVTFSELVKTCLEIAGTEVAGMVMVAESAGLMGAALRRSPVLGASESAPFVHPRIREWLSFTAERAYSRSLALVSGARAGPLPFFPSLSKEAMERREAPPADRRRLANPNPGSAARHGRSPVTRGCRFRARWPSDVGPGASRRSNAMPVVGHRTLLRLRTSRSTTSSLERG